MQNNLSITLQQLDGVGATMVRRAFNLSEDEPVVGDFRSGILTTTGETQLTLPTAQVRQVLIRNTHASAKIEVEWTPNGGAKATIVFLGPGDVVTFWNQSEHASYGISAVYLTSDVADATYETFFGG